MNKINLPLGAAVLLALLVTGCETDGGVGARAQEKSAAYASFKPWQKKYIDKGTVATGFTPDMVYIAMGRADKVETKTSPEGQIEMWTYDRFYPNVNAADAFKYAGYTSEAPYQASKFVLGTTTPLGMGRSPQSISVTGPPQGGTMEPAAPQSYMIRVFFEQGKVARIWAQPNIN